MESLAPNHVNGKPWYSEGVLPISVYQLKDYKGTKSSEIIKSISERNLVYTRKIRTRRYKTIFITNETLPLFFRNTTTEDYKRLKTGIENSTLNKYLNNPFGLFIKSDLINSDISTEGNIKRGESTSRADKIMIRRDGLYVINRLNAGHFVKKGDFKEGKRLSKLLKIIDKQYEEFVNWTQNKKE